MTKVSVMYPNSLDVKLAMVYSKNKDLSLLSRTLGTDDLKGHTTGSRNCTNYSLRFCAIRHNYALTF
jgi:hypothetical protein